MDGLDAIFFPNAVALVGISSDPNKHTSRVLTNLQKFGYAGKIYPVHPINSEILGLKAYRSIHEIPGNIDLVHISRPPAEVTDILRQAAGKGARAALIFSGGFSEHDEIGKQVEKEVVETARKLNMRLLGPNSAGIYNSANGLALSNLSTVSNANLISAPIAILTQSGGIVTSLHARISDCGIEPVMLATLGNQADIKMAECMDYFLQQSMVKVIVIALEGLQDAQSFAKIAHGANRLGKPIIAFHVGKSKVGAVLAQSHSGAMIQSKQALQAMFRDVNMIEADTLEEAVALAQLAAFITERGAPVLGSRTRLLSHSGGSGIIVADQIETAGMQVPPLSADLCKQISPFVPAIGHIGNPVDLTTLGYDSMKFKQLVHCLVDDQETDWLIVAMSPTAGRLPEFAEAVATVAEGASKPIIPFLMAGSLANAAAAVFNRKAIPCFRESRILAEALVKVTTYYENSRLLSDLTDRSPASTKIPLEILAGRETDFRTSLANLNLPVVRERLVDSPEGLDRALRELKFPLVMKALVDGISHKSQVGLVALPITDAAHAAITFGSLMQKAKAIARGQLHGVIIQEMVKSDAELILGISTDSVFGPVLMLGWGGILAEIHARFTTELLPLSNAKISRMFGELGLNRYFERFDRGDQCSDQLTEVLFVISDLYTANAEHLQALDLNPLMIGENGVHVVDTFVQCRYPESRHGERDHL